MDLKDKGFSTKAVHSGETIDRGIGALITPIYETSVFAFSRTDDLVKVISEEKEGFIYTRYDNPTIRAAEKKTAELEGAEDAAVFSSGMAAIATTILTLVKSGDHLVSSRDIYGGTLDFFKNLLPNFGVETSFFEATDIEEMQTLIRDNTKVVFTETPTNPTLKIVDLPKIVECRRNSRTAIVVDSTFASPFNLKPIQHGADIVIHSATKYLCGHNDVTGGVVCGPKEFMNKNRKIRRSLGGILDPFAAWLLLRGLKTLGLRMEKQNKSGLYVAKFLERQPKVKKVYYPGLSSHPQHVLAKKLMKGFGGVVSFEIKGNFETAVKFVESLELCTLAASLGGCETLVTQPVTSTHYFTNGEERQKAGITRQMIRLALGIEEPDDIIADLQHAFSEIED